MGKKIRIVVYTDYACFSLPEWVESKLTHGKYSIKGRMEIAQLLDKLPSSCVFGCKEWLEIENNYLNSADVPYLKVENVLEDNGNVEVQVKVTEDNGETFYSVGLTVYEVDTEKPWRIVTEDGRESLEYFHGVIQLDEEYNMCMW